MPSSRLHDTCLRWCWCQCCMMHLPARTQPKLQHRALRPRFTSLQTRRSACARDAGEQAHLSAVSWGWLLVLLCIQQARSRGRQVPLVHRLRRVSDCARHAGGQAHLLAVPWAWPLAAKQGSSGRRCCSLNILRPSSSSYRRTADLQAPRRSKQIRDIRVRCVPENRSQRGGAALERGSPGSTGAAR